ncbi:CorA family divalent cation transporter, partial [Streptomyces sp. URMC 123]|uniref:CorA family divalent cation transporter n=1 Tax=Streptomyces sp. URMC 123 TaxID=3423403 RepID=UPI003F1D28B2
MSERRPRPLSTSRRSAWLRAGGHRSPQSDERTATRSAGAPTGTGSGGGAASGPNPGTVPGRGPGAAEESSVVHAAVYQDGRRVATPASLAETFRKLREQQGGMAWIGLHRPTETELLSLAEEFDLHPLAVEDALEAHQRPKLERYGDTLFVVLRAARYLDAAEEVDFGELHVFVGADFVITVRHGAAP